jgi:hypothetical protein
MHGRDENGCKILIGYPEGKISFGRTRPRWERNIRLDLREIGWEGVDWFHLALNMDQWRALVEHGNGSSGSIKGSNFLSSCVTVDY